MNVNGSDKSGAIVTPNGNPVANLQPIPSPLTPIFQSSAAMSIPPILGNIARPIIRAASPFKQSVISEEIPIDDYSSISYDSAIKRNDTC